MRLLRLNIRLLALAAVVVVLVLAAGSLAPRQTWATEPDPTGVMCGYLHTMTLNGAPLLITGTTLTRIDYNFDPKDGNPNDVAITAVAYTSATETMPDCKTYQEPIPPGVPAPDVTAEDRPGLIGKYDGDNKISGSYCQQDFEFGGFPMVDWTRITLQLNMSKDEPATQSSGSFTFENAFATEADCLNPANDPTPGVGTIVVQFNSLYLDGPGGDKTAFSSDWDKDGCRDWDELSPYPAAVPRDPFNPNDCSIGGVAELPEVEGTPLEAVDSSGGNAGLLIAVVAAAATAGAVALGGAAWYARRRWLA